MPMSFAQKRELLAYLAEPARWETHDINALLADPERKLRYIWDGHGRKFKVLPDDTRVEIPNRIEDKPLWSANTSIIRFHDRDWPVADRTQLLNRVKLVVAFDLGIEPDMRAQNVLDIKNEKPDEALPGFLAGENPEEPRLVEVPWNDTTEFEGFVTGQTDRFVIEKTTDGFLLATVLEYKERIINQAALAARAFNDEGAHVMLNNRPATSDTLLSELRAAGSGMTPYGGEWQYAVMHSPQPPGLAVKIRHLLGNVFHLAPENFAVITIDQDMTLAAASRENLDQAVQARTATLAFMKVAEQGLPAGEDPTRFLKKIFDAGADLKYVNPDAARTGHTLADELLRFERYELLAALRDLKGLHNLGYKKPQPPEPGPH